MQDEDRIRVGHMIEAAEDALGFIAGRTRADLDTNRMLLFALVRAVEIIGEAASKVSDETRNAHAGIPWKSIIGMRNRLVHAYFDIDADILWVAVTVEIPALLAQVKALTRTP
ncbi:HepT-like ribonuclease domain-containing protein [Lamprocystis purpurea]|jgi:uncharacterized protein with HEPN domain|uniref:HepT-like ribonuclease domain-containing protein n=1 Tax=Lamprocystis purpurea TaxID=61598 RepID=UPI00035EF481|nr:DUF86 domain-containing protein [Lamprocystis purpurea]